MIKINMVRHPAVRAAILRNLKRMHKRLYDRTCGGWWCNRKPDQRQQSEFLLVRRPR